jgi:hypothetical protein
MTADNDPSSSTSQWPVSALVALLSLAVALAALWLAFSTQQETLRLMESSARQQADRQLAQMSEFQKTLAAMQAEQRQAKGFMVRQHHYARLMQLLAQTYILTERLEPAALAEVQHLVNEQLFAIEPFLTGDEQAWLARQLRSIDKLSARLADPMQDYEENLLATKTTLRELIDETRAKTYDMLFPENLEVINDAQEAGVE